MNEPVRPAFSAQRQRELNRLNQIERRRQLLELKRQNDLFDQMSASVSHPAPQSSGASPVAATGGPRGEDDELLASKAGELIVNDAPVTSPLDQPLASAPNHLPEQSSSAHQDEAIHLSAGQPEPAGDAVGDEQGQSAPLDSGQLARFVSCQVPKNKRVLCLIVRDKLSRFGKTKSYFYPTYYLFVQAIVDIDETLTSTTCVSSGATADDEHLIDSPPLPLARNLRAADSADCSFSASSSISADMLFIGTTGAGGNAAPVATADLPSGNSYSDNEICAASDEENPYPAARTGSTTATMTARAGSSFKSAANLQGRDSPLVFPNRDTGAVRGPGSAARKSGSIGLRTEAASSNGESDDESSSAWQPWIGQHANRNSASRQGDKTDHNASDHYDDTTASLFDNERNPYTATYGVLLASRRRKKAKT